MTPKFLLVNCLLLNARISTKLPQYIDDVNIIVVLGFGIDRKPSYMTSNLRIFLLNVWRVGNTPYIYSWKLCISFDFHTKGYAVIIWMLNEAIDEVDVLINSTGPCQMQILYRLNTEWPNRNFLSSFIRNRLIFRKNSDTHRF